ncbi:RSP_2648 family PIN domain-containing protein [Nereida sp. MMG025]|uniref:RSP_2648 family PIN domain-containing protein n=1 Tax=Nereida sp. MMG025 TaxID=2909981 RepID=UPI001F27443B|nr:PIN domain-containing protein [Nereida sp. MMG025]MCF6443560.1 PIN domain-containing protein [Nereida sp. MMG025]
MKVMIDACVLYPTVMRQVVIGAARAGLYQPQWSPRLLEEWARAAARHGGADEAAARSEAVMLNAAFPRANVQPREGDLKRLWLPDENDIHVLAAAVAGSTDIILTNNAKDFPRGLLAEEGVSRADPDQFLLGLWQANPDPIAQVVEDVRVEADRLSGSTWSTRGLLKKARMPRLGKALA